MLLSENERMFLPERRLLSKKYVSLRESYVSLRERYALLSEILFLVERQNICFSQRER